MIQLNDEAMRRDDAMDEADEADEQAAGGPPSTVKLAVADAALRQAAGAHTVPVSVGDRVVQASVRSRLFGGGGPEPTRIGRFVIVRKIGAGGMGVVYSAYDEELDRKVAIKLLHAERAGSQGRARILREAQALARISHPNIVHVYEVGEFEGQVFMAMEFVEGETLDAWARRGKRSWREILAAYVQAGQGLAAAHETGLIHRDVKPENILMSGRGRVIILDFGLARLHDEGRTTAEGLAGAGASASLELALASPDAIARTLTENGTVMGTPAYMSPEQCSGLPLDARSDLFSFCVALYEGLYGERPFGGRSLSSLLGAILSGEVREAPRGTKVPAWLRRVLLRGLAVKPDERWPSMTALLEALADDPSRARFRWLGAAAVAGSLAMGVAGAWQPWAQGGVCRGGAERIASVWGDAKKAEVRAAIERTGLVYAEKGIDQAHAVLDAYAARWVSMYGAACEAHQRGEHSDELYDREVACLDSRLLEFGALVDVLASADEGVAARLGEIVGKLEPLAVCGDTDLLRERYAPPAEHQVAAVKQIQRQLIDIRTKAEAGRAFDVREEAKAAVRAARQLGYRPLVADALHHQGLVHYFLGETKEAEPVFLEAFMTADAVRHDELAAQAGAMLVFVVGYHDARHQEGLIRAEHVQAVIERLGRNSHAQAKLENALGAIYYGMARYEESRRHYEGGLAIARALDGGQAGATRFVLHSNLAEVCELQGDVACMESNYQQAIDLVRGAFGPEHPKQSHALFMMAKVRVDQRRYDEAEALMLQGLEVVRAAFGEHHPRYGMALWQVGKTLLWAGRPGRARDYLARALAVAETTFGERHSDTLWMLVVYSEALIENGATDEALSIAARAVDIHRELFGEEGANGREAILVHGRALQQAGRHEEALAAADRYLAITRRFFGVDHPDLASGLAARARAELALGRLDDAAQDLAEARRLVGALAPDHWWLVEPLRGSAEVALARGQAGAAREAAEVGLRVLSKHGCMPQKRAELGLLLARALEAGGDPPARVLDAAVRALGEAEALEGDPPIRAELAAFVDARRPAG